jgi:hypothetical protein
MKEFVLKGRLTLERVTFYISAKTLEGALARAANGDSDGYDTVTRPKALIGTCLWPRWRTTPDAALSRQRASARKGARPRPELTPLQRRSAIALPLRL